MVPIAQSKHHSPSLSVKGLFIWPPYNLDRLDSFIHHFLNPLFQGIPSPPPLVFIRGSSPVGRSDFSDWLVWEKGQGIIAQHFPLPSLPWKPSGPLCRPRPMFSEAAPPTRRPGGPRLLAKVLGSPYLSLQPTSSNT